MLSSLFALVAVGVVIGSLIYLVSAIKGEEWRTPMGTTAGRSGKKKYVPAAPDNPPPRRPAAEALTAQSKEDSL